MKLLSKIQAGLIAAIVSLFFIAGCSDGFSPVPVAEKGMVTVRIGNEENSRTLFPQTPVFSRYELQFTPGSGQAAKSPESVTNANTTISLATGNWTITAIAYINISGIEGIPNGEYEAARGSKNLTVQLGTNNVSIDIQGDVEDGTGIFSYDISYPADVGVAALKVLSLEGDVLEEVDMKTDDASSGSFTLDAGYYLLRLELEKGEGKIVKTEVIHIYKNLTTPAQGDGYSFSDSDFLIITDNDISFNMVEIPGGVTFPTGTNDNGTATITYAYQMGETEVTWEQWNTVRTWAVANGYSMSEGQKGSSGDGSDQQPVTMVNWYDSIVWCNALTEYWNEKTGENLATVYNNGGSPIRDAGETSALNGVTPSVTAKGFRLPTSNEWELAARWRDDDTNTVAGYSDPWFTKGDSASGATANSNTGDVAVYQDNSGDTTSAVKNKTPNALGLYDMSGNVWEWCFETSGASSVTRGGALNDPNSYQRIGYVHSDNPIDKAYNHGFRLARTGDENEYTFTDIATLQTWLANLPANPPPAAPYLV
ncbi:MAG: formylglycine-generating enzyme family protein, partial [Treponema sp.]|nr:formylglycine-generating enzyme family protein [Treponema sp.]